MSRSGRICCANPARDQRPELQQRQLVALRLDIIARPDFGRDQGLGVCAVCRMAPKLDEFLTVPAYAMLE